MKETTRLAIQHLTIDPTHSTIEFAVTYAMNTIIKGRFHEYEGRITLDTENPAESRVSVTIRSESLDTGADDRDEHLKGDEFFAVETHDEIRFESTSIDVVGNNHWNVHGDLSVIGVTRAVILDSRFYGIVEDAFGNTRAGFVGETDITRSDWGMDWNAEQDTGVLVSDRVRISLYISAVPVEDESEDEEPDTE